MVVVVVYLCVHTCMPEQRHLSAGLLSTHICSHTLFFGRLATTHTSDLGLVLNIACIISVFVWYAVVNFIIFYSYLFAWCSLKGLSRMCSLQQLDIVTDVCCPVTSAVNF